MTVYEELKRRGLIAQVTDEKLVSELLFVLIVFLIAGIVMSVIPEWQSNQLCWIGYGFLIYTPIHYISSCFFNWVGKSKRYYKRLFIQHPEWEGLTRKQILEGKTNKEIKGE